VEWFFGDEEWLMATYHLDDAQPHAFWDNTFPPRLQIEPGDTVIFDTLEAFGGQVTPDASLALFETLDTSQAHALTGPVSIKGAEPGDTLVVEILDIQHKGWGCSFVFPGFGLLADEFPTAYLHQCTLEADACWFRDDIRIPVEAFCGVMGVAPREPGRLRTIPPRHNGGNLDVRHLTAGTTALFPVLAPGALFSCGDGHAAQGDGEINGTGIECPLTVTLRFDLQKGVNIPEMRFITSKGKRLSVADADGYMVMTAHGPDLYANAQQAVRYVLDYLVNTYDLTREAAYCLCGAAVDLKISEIVDAPNWIVSAYVPRSIFLNG
jgi:acetamidase/formamidase